MYGMGKHQGMVHRLYGFVDAKTCAGMMLVGPLVVESWFMGIRFLCGTIDLYLWYRVWLMENGDFPTS